MKPIFFNPFFFACALLFALCGQARADDFTIRGFHWGAGVADVKAAEKSTFRREAPNGAESMLVYSDTYLGETVSVTYKFIHGKLFEVEQYFETKGRKCKEMSAKFNEVVADLTAKNGAPKDSAPTGAACDNVRAWDLGDTMLSVNLSTASGRSDLYISALSKELAGLAEQVTTTTIVTKKPTGANN